MNKSKKIKLNLFISLIAQIITLVLGMVIPRIILKNWGSEYNGLVSSVTTIMQYLTLLEAGINTSTIQALYKCIGENNQNGISKIIKTSQNYYHKMSIVYFFLILLIAFLYPVIIESEIDYWTMFAVFILQGIIGLINFAFRASYQQLLNAEGKYYIIVLVKLLTTILTYIGQIIAISIFNSIIIMQIFGVIIMSVQVFIYVVYFKKKYSWINDDVDCDISLLENRKFYLVQQIAGLVFNSTDVVILGIFCGFKVVSVYTLYNMVFSALTMLIGILRNSTGFIMGQSFFEGNNEFKNTYSVYSAAQVTLGCILSSCYLILINYFINLYTKGVNDINYINTGISIIFAVNLIIECFRGASLSATNIAGKAPQTTWRYIFEALINLIISLSLVKKYSIFGVLLGTMISGIWRSIDSIIYLHKNVLKNKSKNELLYDCYLFCIFIIVSLLGLKIHFNIVNYFDFFIYGLITFTVISLIFLLNFIIIYRKKIKYLLTYLKK